ncbi:hypothetical protein EVG20_g2409 [Dentipellis fragilis]|uniref:Uncharacterized protein n=1 Tax=Dentipellis fragilis TaxID=205917 RepID=A0A4Y9Z9B9_9AGAM|nr:hypothetical protein EVG20_g2409 [Dentipellis fragilis]
MRRTEEHYVEGSPAHEAVTALSYATELAQDLTSNDMDSINKALRDAKVKIEFALGKYFQASDNLADFVDKFQAAELADKVAIQRSTQVKERLSRMRALPKPEVINPYRDDNFELKPIKFGGSMLDASNQSSVTVFILRDRDCYLFLDNGEEFRSFGNIWKGNDGTNVKFILKDVNGDLLAAAKMRYFLEAETPVISSRAISNDGRGADYVRRGLADWQTLLQEAADNDGYDWKLYAPKVSRVVAETAAGYNGNPSPDHDGSTPISQARIPSGEEGTTSIPSSPPSNRRSQEESVSSRTLWDPEGQTIVSPNNSISTRTGSSQPSARPNTPTDHTRPSSVPATEAQNTDHLNNSPQAGPSGLANPSASNGERVSPENTSAQESPSRPVVQPAPPDTPSSHAPPTNTQPVTTSRRRRWYDPIVSVVNYVVNR